MNIYERRHNEATHLDRQVAQILRDDPDLNLHHARATTSKLPGDTLSLRGIPALARGVGGAINGSRPGQRL